MYAAPLGTFLQRDPLPQEGEPTLGYSHEAVTEIMALRISAFGPMQDEVIEPMQEGASLNLYAYANNNPSTYTDPSGLAPIECECYSHPNPTNWGPGPKKVWLEKTDCKDSHEGCCTKACRQSKGMWSGQWKQAAAEPDKEAQPLCQRAHWSTMKGADCIACCIEQNDFTNQIGGLGVLARPPHLKRVASGGKAWYQFSRKNPATSNWIAEYLVKGRKIPSNSKLVMRVRMIGVGGLVITITEGCWDISLISYCLSACE